MTKVFEDDLVLEEDTTFGETIKVKGDIKAKDGNIYSLKVEGNIDAGNIYAWNIDAHSIDAGNIDAYNIDAENIDAFNIDARDIDAGNIDADNIDADNIDARDIDAFNIDAGDIDAQEISYYAFCIARKNIRCTKIEGRRKNSKHLALDGNIEIKQEKCPECGQKIKEVEEE